MSAENRSGQFSGPAVRQSIFLDPHGGRWLFALDRPAIAPRDSEFQAGGFLESARPIASPHGLIGEKAGGCSLTKVPVPEPRSSMRR